MDAAAIILPLFGIVAAGYLLGRFGPVTERITQDLAAVLMRIVIPSVLIVNIVSSDILDMGILVTASAYGVGSVACMGVLLVGMRMVTGRLSMRARLGAFGASVSNTMFIGLPIAMQLFDRVPIEIISVVVLVENVVMIPLGMLLLDRQTGSGWLRFRRSLQRALTTPIVIALMTGLVLVVAGVTFVEPLERMLRISAGAATPLALLMLGLILAQQPSLKINVTVAALAAAKLVLHPVLVLAAAWLFSITDPLVLSTLLIVGAAPMLSIYTAFGIQAGETAFASMGLAFTTLVSVVTLTLWLSLMRLWF